MIAPSNSLPLVLMFLATYLLYYNRVVTPSLNNLFLSIDIEFQIRDLQLNDSFMNLESKRCSISCISTGALSEVTITHPF